MDNAEEKNPVAHYTIRRLANSWVIRTNNLKERSDKTSKQTSPLDAQTLVKLSASEAE
jgi:hypothetical protein